MKTCCSLNERTNAAANGASTLCRFEYSGEKLENH